MNWDPREHLCDTNRRTKPLSAVKDLLAVTITAVTLAQVSKHSDSVDSTATVSKTSSVAGHGDVFLLLFPCEETGFQRTEMS